MAPSYNLLPAPVPLPTIAILVIVALATALLFLMPSAFGMTLAMTDGTPRPNSPSQGSGRRHRRNTEADVYVQNRRQSFEKELARERRPALQDYLDQNGLPSSLLDQLDLMTSHPSLARPSMHARSQHP